MRLFTSIRIPLLALAVGWAVPAAALAQAKQAPPPAKKAPAPAPQKAAPAPQKAVSVTKAPVQQKVAPPAAKKQAPAKAPAKAAPAPAKSPEPAPPAPATVESPDLSPGGRRDPFAALVASSKAGKRAEVRAEGVGVAGMVTATLRVDGVVRTANGMIAVVRNSQGRVYFVREGTRISDGRIERITLEGLTIRETSRDAFNKPVERLVSKRLYPSAGE